MSQYVLRLAACETGHAYCNSTQIDCLKARESKGRLVMDVVQWGGLEDGHIFILESTWVVGGSGAVFATTQKIRVHVGYITVSRGRL